MKRIISFRIEEDEYIFEENNERVLKINKDEKILNGNEIYTNFFKYFSKGDSFEFIDRTTTEEKIKDKLCQPIFEKVQELFKNVESKVKAQIFELLENEENSIYENEV